MEDRKCVWVFRNFSFFCRFIVWTEDNKVELFKVDKASVELILSFIVYLIAIAIIFNRFWFMKLIHKNAETHNLLFEKTILNKIFAYWIEIFRWVLCELWSSFLMFMKYFFFYFCFIFGASSISIQPGIDCEEWTNETEQQKNNKNNNVMLHVCNVISVNSCYSMNTSL